MPTSLKFASATVKDSHKVACESDIRYAIRAKAPRKAHVLDVKPSKSIRVSKSSIYAQTQERLFGGMPFELPSGTPLIHMLKLLNEE